MSKFRIDRFSKKMSLINIRERKLFLANLAWKERKELRRESLVKLWVRGAPQRQTGE